MRPALPALLVAAAAAAAIMFTGCTTTEPVVVDPGTSSHAHGNRAVQMVGDYHVMNFMNRRASKIGIQILDRYEEPYYLDEESLRAEITGADGATIQTELTGEGYSEPEPDDIGFSGGMGATVYTRRFGWIRDAHHASLRVWFPLPDGRTYQLDFACTARKALGPHGHE